MLYIGFQHGFSQCARHRLRPNFFVSVLFCWFPIKLNKPFLLFNFCIYFWTINLRWRKRFAFFFPSLFKSFHTPNRMLVEESIKFWFCIWYGGVLCYVLKIFEFNISTVMRIKGACKSEAAERKESETIRKKRMLKKQIHTRQVDLDIKADAYVHVENSRPTFCVHKRNENIYRNHRHYLPHQIFASICVSICAKLIKK